MNSRHLTTSLVALALALPASRAAAQPDVVSITRRANPAVITLNTYNASGRKTGLGSGFFLPDGRIATNRHVVEGSSRIEVMTVDERTLGNATYAEAVGGPTADLAILPRVSSPPATLNLASGLPEVGEAVVVIGAPEGLSNTVSTGIVSAIRRIQGKTLVQISAPISHGSSGGPVLNMRGEVIGVSVSVLSEGQNLNFAVPVTELSRLASGPRGRIDFSGDLRFGSRGGTGGGSVPSGPDISTLNLRTLPRIAVGQTVSGRLTTSDFRRPDGSFADAYVYNGRAGETITVTLRSNAFDAWAVVDDPNGPLREHDDDSAGDLDAELTVTLPHAGPYLIVANSVAEGATGAYTMSLRSGAGQPVQNGGGGQVSTGDEFNVRSATPIRSGQTVTGQLTRSDTRRDDGSYADSYLYNGRAGERLTVTLRASGFQPWVVVDEPSGPFREHIGGSGSNTASLTVTLPRTGQYIILANSVDAGGTGSYALLVQGGGGGGAVTPPPSAGGGDISDMNVRSLPRIAAGQQVSGRLTTSDFLRSDGSYADGYVYQGRAGERITVTLRSPDMDAWVVVDEPDGPFRETDDDGAGGTDSQLTVTLPRTGVYLIVANSVGSPNTGRYTLQVSSSR
ncbi:MAG TPA: trypsin-like peptidase domain-containing protein [Longimicrobium sp.]|nr:trypsin-like peptidase domain-containing protein [Longimicrobium sp.]